MNARLLNFIVQTERAAASPGIAAALGALPYGPVTSGAYVGGKLRDAGSGARTAGRSALESVLGGGVGLVGGALLGKRLAGKQIMQALGKGEFQAGKLTKLLATGIRDNPARASAAELAAKIRGAAVGGSYGTLAGVSAGGAHGAYAAAQSANDRNDPKVQLARLRELIAKKIHP
jgi:hypothetical protein